MRLLPAVLVAFTLAACGSSNQPAATTPSVAPSKAPAMPISVANLGDPQGIDLLGDGLATVTVSSGQTTASGDTKAPVRFVVKVSLVLDRAGKPVSGGPDNFRFRDANNTMYRAQTSSQAFPPVLAPVDLTTNGQRAEGKLYFDLPEGALGGGHIQLMTGAMVIAVWRV